METERERERDTFLDFCISVFRVRVKCLMFQMS